MPSINAATQNHNPTRPQRQLPQTGAWNQREGESDRPLITPPAHITASQNEYLVELDMPGVNRDGLQITVEGIELTIIGRRQTEMTPGEICYCESGLADYRRLFEVGPDIDIGKISAEMKNGVLKLHLPISERARPKRIEVKIV